MEKDKKYYWLKLKKDFFKRHDIKIIESMPNGKDYVLFYLKLLVESLDHNGSLRFNETIPYDENMLSIITNTNVDIVRSAMKMLQNLELIEVQENKTIFMAEVERMIGTETYWAEKKREYRNEKAIDEDIVLKLSEASPICPSKSIEIEKEIENREKENKDLKRKSTRSLIPFGEYKNVKLTEEEYEKLGIDRDEYVKFLDEYIEEKAYKSKNHNLAIRRWVIKAVEERKLKGTGSRKNGREDMMPSNTFAKGGYKIVEDND